MILPENSCAPPESRMTMLCGTPASALWKATLNAVSAGAASVPGEKANSRASRATVTAAVGVGFAVDLGVGFAVGLGVGLAVGVAVGFAVGATVAVGVGVEGGDAVGLGLGWGVAVGGADGVAVGVGAAAGVGSPGGSAVSSLGVGGVMDSGAADGPVEPPQAARSRVIARSGTTGDARTAR